MFRKTTLAFLIGLVGCVPGELTTDGFGGGGGDGLQQWCDARYDVVGSSSGIVNGTVTTEYPAIGYLSNGGSSFCTGSYIGDRMVLTAAHCVESGGVGFFNFGNSDRSPEQSIRVTRVRIHPMWDSRRLLNDIAVLELQSNPTGIDPLPVLFDTPERGWTTTLVGFGVSDGYRQSGGGIKREVDVTIFDLESTTWSYRTARGGSACNGDSGGPAFYQIPGGPLAVMGITSWGDQYCVENGFYTRLDLYEDFLDGAETPDTMPDGPGEEPPPGTEPPPSPPGGPEPEPEPEPGPGEPGPGPGEPEPGPGPGEPGPGEPGPGEPGPGEPGPGEPGDPGAEKPPHADTCVTARDGYCDELTDSDAPCIGRVDAAFGCAPQTDWTDCHPAP